jgi:hypothetical protein
VAVAGLFYAAEGQVDFGADGGGVDVGDAGFEVANGGEGAVDVLGVEGGRKAVVDGVGDLDGFFKSVNSISETTGPKTSSRAMRISGVTEPKTVGAKKVPLA